MVLDFGFLFIGLWN